ncbi:MAG: methylmalonyl-CoA carboxyltransferase, partial [Solirubrobacterales bacterium]|nr:methylmalonyl-CoA carboxyltransferase [Solirubrobacterales bacterium]
MSEASSTHGPPSSNEEGKPASAREADAREAPATTQHGEATGMAEKVAELAERREAAKLGGGAEKIARQHERGKLTARER